MSENNFQVTGMTCQHCVSAVREEVGALGGVSEVAVDLIPEGISTVRVTSDAPLDIESVRAAIDEAGYDLVAAGD